MYKNKKILAVIPARTGSKGLPKKNIQMLNGKPLIAWSIEQGHKSKYIDKLIVSTDGEEIAEVARTYGAEVPFMRPKELASDTAKSEDVLIHAINFFKEKGEKFDYIVLIEPTSPLRTVDDIDKPLEILIDHKEAKAIVSVAPLEAAHPEFTVTIQENGLIKPYLGSSRIKSKRRQDLDDVYFFEGTIYISHIPIFEEIKGFYHELTLAYVVDIFKSFEVDKKKDLVIIEALMKYEGRK